MPRFSKISTNTNTRIIIIVVVVVSVVIVDGSGVASKLRLGGLSRSWRSRVRRSCRDGKCIVVDGVALRGIAFTASRTFGGSAGRNRSAMKGACCCSSSRRRR